MESLNQLLQQIEVPEYEEYKLLKKRDFSGESIAKIIYEILIGLISTFFTFLLCQELNWWQSFWGILIGLLIAINIFFVILQLIIKNSFDYDIWENYCYIFNVLSKRSSKYLRFIELEEYFLPIEEKIEVEKIRLEKEAITILSNLKERINKLIKINNELVERLKYKRKWREEYTSIIENFTSNYANIKNSLELVNNYLPLIRLDKVRKGEFVSLQWQIRNYDGGHSWLLWKLKYVFFLNLEKRNIKHDNLIKHLKEHEPDISNRLKESFGTKIITSNVIKSPTIKDANQNEEKITITQKTNARENSGEKQLILDFENSENQLEEIETLPKIKDIKPRRTFEGIVKASPIVYHEIADKKMNIGEKGELLVFGYEIKRIINEEGIEFVKKLEHTSKEKGDGFGYDIRSIENLEEVFIEVKTTTGEFWNNLFFTQNERDKMEKIGSKYYLYRVFHFDEKKSTGKLYIFRGADEIMTYCKFSPTHYKLEPNINNQNQPNL